MPCYDLNSSSDQDELGKKHRKKSVDEDGEQGGGNTTNIRRLASIFLKVVDSRGEKQSTAKHLTRVKNDVFKILFQNIIIRDLQITSLKRRNCNFNCSMNKKETVIDLRAQP